uniref:Rha family transcriptional regulator n=1 Tax=uncultured Dysgonomonas sp. TaxID=206096 RepID=UPI002621EF41|nr:Rha family transcriptional regulator [uncultured Dysgonomonas sp.]
MEKNLVKQNESGQVITNSLLVAKKFKKEHSSVIRSIKNLINSEQNCCQFFVSTTYVDTSGKENQMYVMNRDGFTLLAMGFTGRDALRFKIEFIEAFNYMESKLKEIVENQLHQSNQVLKVRYQKSIRVREIDTRINELLRERKHLIKEINHIDRTSIISLGLFDELDEDLYFGGFPNRRIS